MTDTGILLLSFVLPLSLSWMVRLSFPYSEEERACSSSRTGGQMVALFAAVSGAALGYRYIDPSLMYGVIPGALWAAVLKSCLLWRYVTKKQIAYQKVSKFNQPMYHDDF